MWTLLRRAQINLARNSLASLTPRLETSNLQARTLQMMASAVPASMVLSKHNLIDNLHQQSRTIYTRDTLLINKLETLIQTKGNQYLESRSRYISKMREFIQQNNIKSLFVDDLATMIGLAKTEDEYDLVDEIAMSLNRTSSLNLDVVGVTLARFYFLNNQSDRALKNILDTSNFGSLFTRLSSYKTVMCLLYENGRYEDVAKVYQASQASPDYESAPYSSKKLLQLVLFASYARIGTRKALDVMEQLYNKDKDNALLQTKFIGFLSYVHYLLGQDAAALNWIAVCRNRGHIVCQELKLRCLFRLERYEDIEFMLGRYLEPNDKKMMISGETFKMLQSELAQLENEPISGNLLEMLDSVKSAQLVDDELTLEKLIFRPVHRVPKEFGDSSSHSRDEFQNRIYRSQEKPRQTRLARQSDFEQNSLFKNRERIRHQNPNSFV